MEAEWFWRRQSSVFKSECGAGELPAGEQDIAVNFIVLPEFFDTAFAMMDMEEENALKEFLVGVLCGKNDQTSYLYFHVAEDLADPESGGKYGVDESL